MNKETLITRLKDIVGEDNVLFSEMDLTLYGYDASMEKGRPDAVVLPGSTEEVSQI
ncbi:MAG: FAD-binding oxidoreductase, partial [Desulfobacterales bacterium]|nr:FAD-binding oxidoreductase [Desulfobacterales bacterium]